MESQTESKEVSKIIYWQESDTKQKVVDALKKNYVLITTTDTIPGFCANITELGFDRLNKIKGGRQAKPYIILISDLSKIEHFVDLASLNLKVQDLLKKCWPGPLTVIFKARKDLPYFLKSAQDTVAIRCPSYLPLQEILKHFDGLFSTSANKSEQKTPDSIQSLDPDVFFQVKYVVDEKGKQSISFKPSTIIDVSKVDSDQIYLVRQGVYSVSLLEDVVGKIIK